MDEIPEMRPLPGSIFHIIVNNFYNKELKEFIKKEIMPSKGIRLLDVPCGKGILGEQCRSSDYIGVDIEKQKTIDAKKNTLWNNSLFPMQQIFHSAMKFLIAYY